MCLTHLNRIIVGAALASAAAVLLAGCGWRPGFADGEAEAARLGGVVAQLAGVESVETTGSEQSTTDAAVAIVEVRMGDDASPGELEGVLLGWNDAGTGRDGTGIRRVLQIEYRTTRCVSEVTFGAEEGQLKDTARFLPALCAMAEGGYARTNDTGNGRSVSLSRPDLLVDIAQLRALPGAVTDRDYWTIGGVEYRWDGERE